MYRIVTFKKAQNEFGKLPKEAKKRIIGVLERASINPYRYAKKMSGEKSYRLHAGKYRIVFDISEKEKRIEILRIGHRESIYD